MASTVTSPAGISYLVFIARLYHGIEATICQAERFISALAHLIGDLRSRMLASKVERKEFIRLNRHLIGEVRNLDAAVAQVRARVATSAQISVAAQKERSNMSVDLTVKIPQMVMCIVSLVCLPLFIFFSAFFLCVLCCCFRGFITISMAFNFFVIFRFFPPVLSTCPFHTNSGCGKERRILIAPW